MPKADICRALAMAGKAIIILAIGGLSLTTRASGNPSIEFTDPSAKGSLIIFDFPSIPQEYHGVWADHPSNCYTSADRGVQASISDGAIGYDRTVLVEGYSDHPGLVVTLKRKGGKKQRVALDISLDGRYVQIIDLKSERENVLQKCPPPPRSYLWPNPDVRNWFEAARKACKARHFPNFLKAVARSREVQRLFLAPRIIVHGPTDNKPIAEAQYEQFPILLRHNGYILTDWSNGLVIVVVAIVKSQDDGFRVNWHQVDGAGDRIQDGHEGWLLFERTTECWALKEQGRN